MSSPISPEQLSQYRVTHQKREQQRQTEKLTRQHQGQQLAHQAAHLLKTQFGATQIILFGSMTHLQRIHPSSDIDLAASGIPDRDYLRALGALQDLSGEFSFDLIQLERATPRLKEKIKQEGETL